MTKIFRRGDHVEWNSEVGRVRGVIVKKVISAVRFKGYVHHASKDEPQYIIKSEKTDHVAIHKGQALKHIRTKEKMKPKKTKQGERRADSGVKKKITVRRAQFTLTPSGVNDDCADCRQIQTCAMMNTMSLIMPA